MSQPPNKPMLASVRIEGDGQAVELCFSLDTLALQMSFMESMASMLTLVETRFEMDADVSSKDKEYIIERIQLKQREIKSLKQKAHLRNRSNSKERLKLVRLPALEESECDDSSPEPNMTVIHGAQGNPKHHQGVGTAPPHLAQAEWRLPMAIRSIKSHLSDTLRGKPRKTPQKVQPIDDLTFHPVALSYGQA